MLNPEQIEAAEARFVSILADCTREQRGPTFAESNEMGLLGIQITATLATALVLIAQRS